MENEKSSRCPKCNGTMEEGISVEYKVMGGVEINTNNPKVETWGKKVNKSWWQDFVDSEIPVVTYRCIECGFLESYAKSPPNVNHNPEKQEKS